MMYDEGCILALCFEFLMVVPPPPPHLALHQTMVADMENSGRKEPTDPGVVRLFDYFEHTGPNGKHVCMVFEVREAPNS
jgi:hypothetical protein